MDRVAGHIMAFDPNVETEIVREVFLRYGIGNIQRYACNDGLACQIATLDDKGSLSIDERDCGCIRSTDYLPVQNETVGIDLFQL